MDFHDLAVRATAESHQVRDEAYADFARRFPDAFPPSSKRMFDLGFAAGKLAMLDMIESAKAQMAKAQGAAS